MISKPNPRFLYEFVIVWVDGKVSRRATHQEKIQVSPLGEGQGGETTSLPQEGNAYFFLMDNVGIPQDQTTRSLLSKEMNSATILFECKRSPCDSYCVYACV